VHCINSTTVRNIYNRNVLYQPSATTMEILKYNKTDIAVHWLFNGWQHP